VDEEEKDRMLMRHDTDLYYGRGKNDPPITGRLLLLENAVARIIENSSKIVWLLAGTLAVGLANLIFHPGK
jgi:hypothetical protein